MNKSIFLALLLISLVSSVAAQISPGGGPPPEDTEGGGAKIERKFSAPKEKIKRAPVEWYKIISVEKDSTYLDTTLTIQKEYAYNYLRKDDFELEAFSNIGSPYTQLAKQQFHFSVLPHFGASVRHLAYLEAQDIPYYEVPTPLTELYYKTALEQGQQLDALVSLNTSKNFNITLGYKGVRSLGAYQNALTSTKSFRGMLSYRGKKERYYANFHFTDQRLLNEENGGLTTDGLENFLGGDSDLGDRATIGVSFENAQNLLDGKRLYLDHEYNFTKPDSLGNGKLALKHEFNYFTKKWYFDQSDTDEDYFGPARTESDFSDRVELTVIQNKLGAQYNNAVLGSLGFFARHSYHNYGYDQIFVTQQVDDNGDFQSFDILINDRLIGETISLGANYENDYKGFLLQGNAESTISGPYTNQYLRAAAGYHYKEKVKIDFGYELKSEAPGFNKQLYQSNYTDYFANNDFENTLTNTFFGDFNFKNNLWVRASFSIIDDYSYFLGVPRSIDSDDVLDDEEILEGENNDNDDEDPVNLIADPTQTDATISVLKVKAFKEFAYGHFRLANTLMYQQVAGSGADLYNLPNFVTRNSLYYQGNVFKKAMFLQSGFTFKYFSKFFADGYDPILAENFVQRDIEIGNYPQVDFFLNSKVRQTRIYFKLENLQDLLISQNTNLVAPNYGSRDFLIRFGLVWNFFL